MNISNDARFFFFIKLVVGENSVQSYAVIITKKVL